MDFTIKDQAAAITAPSHARLRLEHYKVMWYCSHMTALYTEFFNSQSIGFFNCPLLDHDRW
jgi:hypothetical protein